MDSREAAYRRRKARAKRKRRRKILGKLLSFLVVFLAIVGLVAYFGWKRYSPTKERADLTQYFKITANDQLAVIFNNEVVEPCAISSEGTAYLQFDVIRDKLNDRFYWDSNENLLLYTLPNDTVTVGVGSREYTVSKEQQTENYVILKTVGSTAYVALDFVKKYSDFDFEVYDDPGRVSIVTEFDNIPTATVSKDTAVRYQGGVKSPVLTDIVKGDEVVIVESEENWKKVRTKDGFIGYVKNNTLKAQEDKSIQRNFTQPEFTSISKGYTINMVWHNVTNEVANANILQVLANSKGLNTIAPTWFHVADTSGNLSSIASADYVNYAHQANVEVWATIRDFDGGINSYDETYELLSYTSRRTQLVNQLIAASLQYGLDGINVDFEKVSQECGVHFIQFIRELSVKCRQNQIVLSVDNYVPKGFNLQYNRKEQGIFADYVVIMGYDEHYAGSPEAGSVSSYNFVKEGIEETLKEVPANKVISGIPFYTRLWAQTPKTADELATDEGTDAAEYPDKVSSEAYGMQTAKSKVAQSGASEFWDDTAKQNYAEWYVDSTLYRIWLEDAQSISAKLELMKEYGLAGTAAWASGLEDPAIWDVILQYVN
ncbi:MAG: SH3 domain-containing protein [Lachnospiraceae bacterium]|jgi:spore germination protein YaaH|nr:SH3 domain-containing protein [Lachnospiraceae bacterium]